MKSKINNITCFCVPLLEQFDLLHEQNIAKQHFEKFTVGYKSRKKGVVADIASEEGQNEKLMPGTVSTSSKTPILIPNMSGNFKKG